MNYIPLDSYSLFIIPNKTALFEKTNEEGYKTSSISSEEEESSTPSTSTSSPYTMKYLPKQYRFKNHQLTWNTTNRIHPQVKENYSDLDDTTHQLSPMKSVSSSPMDE